MLLTLFQFDGAYDDEINNMQHFDGRQYLSAKVVYGRRQNSLNTSDF